MCIYIYIYIIYIYIELTMIQLVVTSPQALWQPQRMNGQLQQKDAAWKTKDHSSGDVRTSSQKALDIQVVMDRMENIHPLHPTRVRRVGFRHTAEAPKTPVARRAKHLSHRHHLRPRKKGPEKSQYLQVLHPNGNTM